MGSEENVLYWKRLELLAKWRRNIGRFLKRSYSKRLLQKWGPEWERMLLRQKVEHYSNWSFSKRSSSRLRNV